MEVLWLWPPRRIFKRDPDEVPNPGLRGREAAVPRGYHAPPMALLIIFVGITTLTAAAIGGAVAAGTTTAVVVALTIYQLGTGLGGGATLAALGPDGAD